MLPLGFVEFGSREARTLTKFEIKFSEIIGIVAENEVWMVCNSEDSPNAGKYVVLRIPAGYVGRISEELIKCRDTLPSG